jgi:exodeoxyribonuclease-3
MRLATWNVNSLRVRLPHLLAWLSETAPDVVALQETKLIDAKFPRQDILDAGYHVVFAGQPTYNGVAILAKASAFAQPTEVKVNNPRFADDQVRIIAATLTPHPGSSAAGAMEKAGSAPTLRFISAYVPNGAAVGTDKYDYKLRWLSALRAMLADELAHHPWLAIAGDYNIAPHDQDVHDPQAWHEQVLCSTAEREAFAALIDLGLSDGFRLHEHEGNVFSWWDYRANAFRRKMGLRIDHVLLSGALAKACNASGIDMNMRRQEQPSDHAPVWVECDLLADADVDVNASADAHPTP